MKKSKVVKSEKDSHILFFVISFVLLAYGTFQAINLRWVGDDVFIGLRYIDHFLNGEGWIYNPGEHVEGYTNYLWLVIVAFFQYLKFDPVNVSIALGILSYIFIILIFIKVDYEVNKSFNNKIYIPFTVLIITLNYDFAVWATSGLETSFYTLLISLIFYISFFTRIKNPYRLLLVGIIASLSILTRPDSLLLFALINAFVFTRNLILKTPVKQLILEQVYLLLPFFLIYVPYFIWRYNFYGYPFPNTYYSKLAYLTSFDKGFFYIWLYVKCHFSSVLFLLFVFPVYKWMKSTIADPHGFSKNILLDRNKSILLVLSFTVIVYLVVFVAKVGGDFMYARFIAPCMPFMALVIAYSLNYLIRNMRYLMISSLVLVLASFIETNIRKGLFYQDNANGTPEFIQIHGVTDERSFYVNEYKLMKVDKKIGEMVAPYLKGLNVTLHVRGAQACLAYYSKARVCIENHGLTDEYIAHMPVTERGEKIAHEHQAPWEYLIKRGVDFSLNRSPAKKEQQYRLAAFILDDRQISVGFITYNRDLVKKLKERLGANFLYTDFEGYLDNYINNIMPSKSKEDLKKDYNDFKEYYFARNDDKEREAKLLSRL